MTAILKREFNAYFSSPIGYVFIAIFYLCSGAFFYLFTLSSGSTDTSFVFLGMFFIMMIIIPILTMRLMADDNKQKTDQLTLTSPISLFGLVGGKFLAAFVIFLMGVAMIFIYGIVLSCFADINWGMLLGNVVGMLLLGAVFISIGVFISTLTENQMIAAIGGIAVNILIVLMDTLASVIPIDIVQNVMTSLSVYNRYYQFTIGIFSLSNVLFFVSVTFIFLFLTVRFLEKRRWS